MTDVSAVICAFGEQPYLRECVERLQGSRGVSLEVIVVDNGSPDVAGLVGVTILKPGHNTGFAGGCNLGARAASGNTLVFVNSDAMVDPDCLARLADPEGLVCATVLLADETDTVNSWGNPVHVLGFSWAGGYGHPRAQAHGGPVASVSGAVFAVRRSTYLALGMMDEQYFAYGEDVDLSLRATLMGLPVSADAGAIAWHHYEFARNPTKMYLLERNRLITVLTTFEARTLVALAPLMIAAEFGLLAVSLRDGWAGQKIAGWRWLVQERTYLRRRRNRIQGSRRVAEVALMDRLTPDLDPPARFGLGVPRPVRAMITGYWEVVGRRVAVAALPRDSRRGSLRTSPGPPALDKRRNR